MDRGVVHLLCKECCDKRVVAEIMIVVGGGKEKGRKKEKRKDSPCKDAQKIPGDALWNDQCSHYLPVFYEQYLLINGYTPNTSYHHTIYHNLPLIHLKHTCLLQQVYGFLQSSHSY